MQISEGIRRECILQGKTKRTAPNRMGKVVVDEITEDSVAQIAENASNLFFLLPALNTVPGLELCSFPTSRIKLNK